MAEKPCEKNGQSFQVIKQSSNQSIDRSINRAIEETEGRKIKLSTGNWKTKRKVRFLWETNMKWCRIVTFAIFHAFSGHSRWRRPSSGLEELLQRKWRSPLVLLWRILQQWVNVGNVSYSLLVAWQYRSSILRSRANKKTGDGNSQKFAKTELNSWKSMIQKTHHDRSVKVSCLCNQ